MLATCKDLHACYLIWSALLIPTSWVTNQCQITQLENGDTGVQTSNSQPHCFCLWTPALQMGSQQRCMWEPAGGVRLEPELAEHEYWQEGQPFSERTNSHGPIDKRSIYLFAVPVASIYLAQTRFGDLPSPAGTTAWFEAYFYPSFFFLFPFPDPYYLICP